MRRAIRSIVLMSGAVWVVLICAGMASADAHESPSAAAGPSDMTGADASAAEAGPATVASTDEHVAVAVPVDDDYSVVDDPDRYPWLDVPTKPWAYETDYFFGLTRGLGDEDMSAMTRGVAMVGTIPLDVVGLPTAALAGLFGS